MRRRTCSCRSFFSLGITSFLVAKSPHCNSAPAAAAAFSAPPTKITCTASSPDSHRIFVGGLSPSACDSATLKSVFESFGPVQNVAIHGVWQGENRDETERKRKKFRPFAFITFVDADSAKRALSQYGGEKSGKSALYREVKAANPIKPRNQRSRGRKINAADEARYLSHLTNNSNVLLQCPNSHLERLQNFLSSAGNVRKNNGQVLEADVIGSLSTGRKVKLLFINANNPAAFVSELLSVPHISIAISKSYIVNSGAVRGTLSGEVAKEALESIETLATCRAEANGSDSVVRVQSFPPPKTQSSLINAIDGLWDEEVLEGVDISPTAFTHTLSVVQVKEEDANGKGGVYMMGLSRAMFTDAMSTHERARLHSEANLNHGKNRAYNKLQEAFARYYEGDDNRVEGSLHYLVSRFTDAIAVDCGAAPGGWTSYLIEEAKCRIVYSIDPADLSSRVLRLKGVRHMKMRVERALPILERSPNGLIDIFTSDCCLHAMSDQVDWILMAKEANILSPSAMFVITMKCTVGHSKPAYDRQVEEEVKRLDGIARGVKNIHLFSNRSGERTVMGLIP